MIKSSLKTSHIISQYDNNGMLGRLTGITLTERDRIFKEANDKLTAQLKNAKTHNKRQTIDCSSLSGVNSGDYWNVFPDGTTTRELSLFPDIENLMEQWPIETKQKTTSKTEYASFDLIRPVLIRCAYNGLWAPSGTNWQPIRIVELDHNELVELKQQASSNLDIGSFGLAILARTDYESMLGDVAKVSRFFLESRAEFIDTGIYISACELTATALGCPTRSVFIQTQDQPRLTQSVAKILENRKHIYSSSKLRQKAEELLCMISNNEYVLDSLFCPSFDENLQKFKQQYPRTIGELPITPFDELVTARCTQRIASQNREISIDVFHKMWNVCQKSLEPELIPHIKYDVFTWHDEAPRFIGEAMFNGLYGKGADINTGEGGKEGIISRITIPSLLAHIRDINRGQLPPTIQALEKLTDADQEKLANNTPLPIEFIPRRLREFVLSKPQFTQNNGFLVGRTGNPLTMGQFVRMVRLLAFTFGRFFLSFQNTHPITAVILARNTSDPALLRAVYRGVGRMMAGLTSLCRAQGLTSIIKGGPTEINRPGIGEVVAKYAKDPAIRKAIIDQQYLATLTFQLGYPLGVDEIITVKGKSHTGLEERANDKRAPRASLSDHYFPVRD